MGMYTEIYVNVDLKENLPEEALQVLKAMCWMLPEEEQEEVLKEYPQRWHILFNNGSYYTPSTECRKLTFNDIYHQWSLLGKGDIKNYNDEIEQFFEWIMPYVDANEGEFIGYSRYEEDNSPTLIYKTGD